MKPPFIFAARKKQAGFTLVELMIGVVVGLLVLLAVTQSTAFINQQRKSTVSGNDAQENAQAALVLLDGDLRNAGAGLYARDSASNCKKYNAYFNGTVVANGTSDISGLTGVTMPPSSMAVKLVDGGGNSPDTLTMYRDLMPVVSSLGDAGLISINKAMPTPSAVLDVNDKGGLLTNDVFIVKDSNNPDVPCTVFQVTGFTGNDKIIHNSGQSDYNPPNPGHEYTNAPSYGVGALIIRLNTASRPTLKISTYALKDNQLSSCDTVPGAACNSAQTLLVGQIVQLQAQYGISVSATSDVVTSWVNPTGTTWANPSAADAAKIRAVRLVVVARSPEPANETVSVSCTNAAGVINTGPCSFQDAAAPIIDLSVISVPTGKSWQNYRYRTYQTVVPLRNVAWNN